MADGAGAPGSGEPGGAGGRETATPPPRPIDAAAAYAADEEEEEDMEEGADEDDEEDEEFDLKQYGIYQALPVDGEPDWGSEVLDAEEYLRRVRHEAARCPRVVRADVDVDALQAKEERRRAEQQQQQQQQTQPPQQQQRRRPPGAPEEAPPAPPDWAVPSEAWVRQLVGSFQDLRRRVAEAYESGELATSRALPGPKDHQGWDRLCFGRGGADEEAGAGAGGDEAEGEVAEAAEEGGVPGSEITFLSPHILPTLMALDQVGVAALFERHAQQLLDCRPPGLPLARAQWLFALAARLEKPLHAEAAAAARDVARHCALLRARALGAADPLLPRANVLIAVAGAYFGQDESLAGLVDTSELF